jgi:diketogulonate reductase-like aldo/keto reductase
MAGGPQDAEACVERRALGTGGPRVPVLGQGTWQMERDDRRRCLEALRAGLDAGMTHIDTAELYGGGAVEELVGEAIAGRRAGAFLVSKVLPENASYRGTLAACERSLRRLGTDYLDLYLLHWRGPHPLAETFRAFEELERTGKIRAFGVSNFDVADLEEAVSLAGEGRVACNQVLYHLEERGIEHAVIPWCERHGIGVVAYSPFGAGRFPRGRGRRVLDEIASAHDVSAYQVALRFLVRRPSVLAIPKAADVGHVRDNAAAADLRLSDAELERIDEAFPLGRAPRTLPAL